MDGDELDERLRVSDLDVTLGDPDACFIDDDPRDDEISTSLIGNKKKNVRIRPHVVSRESHSIILLSQHQLSSGFFFFLYKAGSGIARNKAKASNASMAVQDCC